MMTIGELDDFMDTHFTSSAFRLEVLDRYDVPTDGGDVARYLAGEPLPDMDRMQPWLDQLRAEVNAGKRRYRVRVLRSPLSDYLRYECEWGYAYTCAAGEEIHVLDLSESSRPAGLCDQEFWLVDDARVVRMHYDSNGTFIGADLVPSVELPHYQACRDAALSAAVPFSEYWAAHPEHHRANQSPVGGR